MKKRILYVSTLFIICALMLTGCGSSGDSGAFGGKKIKYFNESGGSKDKISFTLKYGYGTKKHVFVGVSSKGVAEVMGKYFTNGVFGLSNYESDEISYYLDSEYYTYELEREEYEKKEDGEYIDNYYKILYNDGPFYIVHTSGDYYQVFYKYDEEESYGGSYWHIIEMNLCDTEEEAKQKLNSIKNNVKFCTYEDDVNNCLDANGNKVNYKEYRYIKDLLADSLAKLNLYVDSYEMISYFEHNELNIYKKSSVEGNDKENKFRVSFEEKRDDLEEERTTKINGEKWYIRSPYSSRYFYADREDYMLEVYVTLPYDVQETDENAINAFKEAFSK